MVELQHGKHMFNNNHPAHCLIVLLILISGGCGKERGGGDQMASAVRDDFSSIVEDYREYVQTHRKVPHADLLVIYDTKMLYDTILSSSNDWERTKHWVTNRNMTFVDPWGHDYCISVRPENTRTNVLRVGILSNGPNGVFENGSGDDIINRGFLVRRTKEGFEVIDE